MVDFAGWLVVRARGREENLRKQRVGAYAVSGAEILQPASLRPIYTRAASTARTRSRPAGRRAGARIGLRGLQDDRAVGETRGGCWWGATFSGLSPGQFPGRAYRARGEKNRAAADRRSRPSGKLNVVSLGLAQYEAKKPHP